MFLLPVGHEEDEYHRLPVVALGFMGLCVLVFAVTQYLSHRSEVEAKAHAELVLDFAAEHPGLQIDEEFLFATTQLQLERRWEGRDGELWWDSDEKADPEDQASLDTLTATWRAAFMAAPAYKFGLTPRDFSVIDLVAHILIHGGLLHLIGNLFFFWLVAPPLEDVWGRPLFSAFILFSGVAAGLLWVARYPDSGAPVIGASGAIAGLMGGFMVRFWRSKVRMFYVVFIFLRIKTGFFHAPAWSMLGLWLARELALGSWLEPHSMPVGGVATWAHVFGFGSGALGALAIKWFRVEERWVTPAIVKATDGLENPVIEEASALQSQGRVDEAWHLLSEECRSGRATSDVIGSWWDLAIDLGRQAEVAPYLLRRIQRELSRHEVDLACQHWLELRDNVGEVAVPPNLAVGLAEALIEWGGAHEEYEALLNRARVGLGDSPPAGTLLRLARVSGRVKLPGTRQFCLDHAERGDVEAEVREELRQLAAAAES